MATPARNVACVRYTRTVSTPPTDYLVEPLGASDSSTPTADTRSCVRCQEGGNEHVHLLARARRIMACHTPDLRTNAQTSAQTSPLSTSKRGKFRTFKNGSISFLTRAKQTGDYGSDQLPSSENAIYGPTAQGALSLHHNQLWPLD